LHFAFCILNSEFCIMKKYLFFLLSALSLSLMGYSQAMKPELMVFPSENWCINNGYYTEVTNMDYVQKVPDYRAALQGSMDLKMAIAKINDLFAQRGFPLSDLEQTLKNIEQERAEDMLTLSKNGNELSESPLDMISRVAKADIILELSWEAIENGPKTVLTYVLEAKDAFTGKSLGGPAGPLPGSMSASLPELLNEAIVANMDEFQLRIQDHFNDMQTNGREIRLDIKVFANNEAGIDLETEYGDEELNEIIQRWMVQNTVNRRFTARDASENHIYYTQVRIPLFDDYGAPMSANDFAKKLQKALKKEPFKIPAKVTPKGLGRAVIILGEK